VAALKGACFCGPLGKNGEKMAQEGFLIKQEKYLETGIHIGTKLRVIDMKRFIYRTRSDGLYVLDLRKIDERIRLAGKILAKYDPQDIVVVASRTYSSMAAQAFGKITQAKVVSGRFVPGTFTNVQRPDFVEPKLVIICDPKGERQAVLECGKMGIPTIGLCDTDNYTMFIDWIIPCNNKGRRSLALIFWLLAREMAMNSGKCASYDEFKPTLEEFEASLAAASQSSTEADEADLQEADSIMQEKGMPKQEAEGEKKAEENKEQNKEENKEAKDKKEVQKAKAKKAPKRSSQKKEEKDKEKESGWQEKNEDNKESSKESKESADKENAKKEDGGSEKKD
jgi:small subunit ribosomal protein S2